MQIKNIYLTALIFGCINFNQTSYACLSCGCGSSGSSSDLGSLGSASSIFSKGKKFFIQFGSSFKSINGSFNELGTWNPNPTDSSLSTIQNTLGIMYFPSDNLSVSVQLPLVTNILNQSTWGSFGSIDPTDNKNSLIGTSFGDTSLQATYKFFDDSEADFASAVWARSNFPTGQINGNPQNLSGNGIFSLAGGVFGIKKINNFEFLANVGYQLPLSKSPYFDGSFTIGNAFLYQAQANYQLNSSFKFGFGFSGIIGQWLLSNNNTLATNKIKLVATSQYDLSTYNGVGVSLGYDPRLLGSNSMTDLSLNIVFYQFI